MAIIRKKIENLKPGRDYLISVRTKNPDLNVYSESSNSILVSIPKDTTIPDAISSLALYASFENVMFVFNFSNDLDIDKYEYELYNNQAGTGTPTSAGFNSANVFTVAVPNSTDTVAKSYWGRVRSVDTTGNLGPWTVLVQTDQSTPLIDNQYISNLTASKITAGTIGAHTITLAGTNSILKSNNYAAATANTGGAGWKISGDGKAVFNDASIRSSLDIGEDQGTSDATSFHVDANGNMWSGANSSSFSTAPFKVNNTGNVTANSLTLTGLTQMATGSKIFLGAGNYNNTDTGFYVDSSSNFSLGNKLTWNGTNLTVQGTLKLSDGSDVLNADDVTDILEEAVYVDGFIGGLTISGTKMYYGTGTFSNQNTAFYVAKNITSGQADFSLGNKLTWDGTTLGITGNVVITGGSTLTLINDAQLDADAAQLDADAAYAYADSAFNTANNKITIGGTGITVDNNGFLTQISGNVIRTGLIASNGNTSYIDLSNGRFNFGNSSIYWDGSTLNVNGTVTAGAGDIGGWNIDAGSLRSSVNQTILDPNGYIMVSGNIEASGFVDAEGSLRTSGYVNAQGNIDTASDMNASGSIEAGTFITAGTVITAGSYIKSEFSIQAGTTIQAGTQFIGIGAGTVAAGSSTNLRRRDSDGQFRIEASKRELKKDITSIQNSVDLIQGLNPVSFRFKDESDYDLYSNKIKQNYLLRKEYGFIAEDVAQAVPDLGIYTPDKNSGELVPQMWQQNGVIALCVGAIKDLVAQIETLEARIATLES